MSADQAEGDRAHRRDEDAAQRYRAAAEAVRKLARQGHHHRGAEALRSHQQPCVDHALMADVLPVEREQNHRAE